MKKKIKKLLTDLTLFVLGFVINAGVFYLLYKFILILISVIWIRIVFAILIGLIGLELILRLLKYLLKLSKQKSKKIYQRNYTEGDWPFTVSSGKLINRNDAVIFKCNLGMFAVNGLAKDMGYESMQDIWKVKEVKGNEITYMPVQHIIIKGLKLRNPNADKLYTELTKEHQELTNRMKTATDINQ